MNSCLTIHYLAIFAVKLCAKGQYHIPIFAANISTFPDTSKFSARKLDDGAMITWPLSGNNMALLGEKGMLSDF